MEEDKDYINLIHGDLTRANPNTERYAGQHRRDEYQDRQLDDTRSVAATHAPCVVEQFWV